MPPASAARRRSIRGQVIDFVLAPNLSHRRSAQHLRVGKARESLEFSSLAMKEIAWNVGYEDYGAFRKVFQKIMGLSPGDYRLRFSVHGNRTRN
ncbi:MAG: helix-turn-helix domain-containing protein [Candidatus Sulfotelmatobacter sp.]